MAQDDYYYEIQLTNKQLIFYFMAGAAGLVLSFLAGVWVGRGADPGTEAGTRVQDEKVVAEEPVRPSPSPVQELTYAKRLEGQPTDEALKPESRPSPPVTTEPARPATPKPEPTPRATATPRPKPTPQAEKPDKPPAGKFALQVGAFKDRASAESVVGKLKGKGFPAYVQEGDGGLFNVRVGGYATREEADRIKGRLQDEEKLKPFVVKP